RHGESLQEVLRLSVPPWPQAQRVSNMALVAARGGERRPCARMQPTREAWGLAHTCGGGGDGRRHMGDDPLVLGPRSPRPPPHVTTAKRAPHLAHALTSELTRWRRAGDATRGASARDCRDSPRWWMPGAGPAAAPTASPAGGTPHGDTPWGALPGLP